MSLTSAKRHIIEAYSTIDETARITGVALIPRISRNQNLYTKEELKRFHNVSVPLNWEHNPNKVIGSVTFQYNPELETVYYDGLITDESAAALARNKTLFTSIEAEPTNVREICNGPSDCFSMPFGLVPKGLALTETPGVPETTVMVIESYIKECKADHDLENKYAPDQKNLKNEDHIAELLSEDCISDKISKISDDHPDWPQDKKVAVALSMCSEKEAMGWLAKQVFALLDFKESFCPDCGEFKKKL